MCPDIPCPLEVGSSALARRSPIDKKPLGLRHFSFKKNQRPKENGILTTGANDCELMSLANLVMGHRSNACLETDNIIDLVVPSPQLRCFQVK